MSKHTQKKTLTQKKKQNWSWEWGRGALFAFIAKVENSYDLLKKNKDENLIDERKIPATTQTSISGGSWERSYPGLPDPVCLWKQIKSPLQSSSTSQSPIPLSQGEYGWHPFQPKRWAITHKQKIRQMFLIKNFSGQSAEKYKGYL